MGSRRGPPTSGQKGRPEGPREDPEGPGPGPGEGEGDGNRKVDYRRVVGGPFSDVLPERALARGRYTMRDQLVDLRRIPQRPRKVFNLRHLIVIAKRLFDLFGNRPTRFGRFLSRVNPYPYPFRRVTIRSFDGTRIAGWLGLQPMRRPGIVLVPGLFSSKDDTSQRRKALKMWRKWNYNVLVIDMRGFGQSEQVPSTPGWKEAEDVIAAARFLYSFNPVSRVGVMGESMGATASLLAAAQEGIWEEEAMRRGSMGSSQPITGALRRRFAREARASASQAGREAVGESGPGLGGVDARTLEDAGDQAGGPAEGPLAVATDEQGSASMGPLTSGEVGAEQVRGGRPPEAGRKVISAVFAVSPFAEARPAVAHLDRAPPRSFYFQHSVHRIFRRLLRATTQGRYSSFLEFMEHSARHYGVPVEELYARSDLTRVVAHIRVPTLVLHAEDDDLVPLMHADRLSRLVADREDVAVWILRWGRHVEFDVLDRRWYWRVMSRFMGQWVGR